MSGITDPSKFVWFSERSTPGGAGPKSPVADMLDQNLILLEERKREEKKKRRKEREKKKKKEQQSSSDFQFSNCLKERIIVTSPCSSHSLLNEKKDITRSEDKMIAVKLYIDI